METNLLGALVVGQYTKHHGQHLPGGEDTQTAQALRGDMPMYAVSGSLYVSICIDCTAKVRI